VNKVATLGSVALRFLISSKAVCFLKRYGVYQAHLGLYGKIWKGALSFRIVRAAIICDIKGSRLIKNWGEVFEEVRGILIDLNKKFEKSIFIPFDFTVGDEFQGALKTPEYTYEVLKFLKILMPVRFYCGAGFGEIETRTKDPRGLRGTAFYRAREAINGAKKDDRQLIVISEYEAFDAVVNPLLYLLQKCLLLTAQTSGLF